MRLTGRVVSSEVLETKTGKQYAKMTVNDDTAGRVVCKMWPKDGQLAEVAEGAVISAEVRAIETFGLQGSAGPRGFCTFVLEPRPYVVDVPDAEAARRVGSASGRNGVASLVPVE